MKHYAIYLVLLVICVAQDAPSCSMSRSGTRCELALVVSLHTTERCLTVVERCLVALDRDPVIIAARGMRASDVSNPCASDGDTDHDCTIFE